MTDPDDVLRLDVTAAGASYPVLVGVGLLARAPELIAEAAPAHRYAVVSDGTVAERYGRTLVEAMAGAGLAAVLVDFPPGERSKTRNEWARLTDALLDAGLGRDGAIVALGGGVTGDLAGFVAATFMRGIPVVQVPTSLLAMVDASIGGKTGVDVRAGKNLVGAFHPPRAVISDPALAATQSRAGRAEGLVEAVKHGAILSEDYLAEVRDAHGAALNGDAGALNRVVAGSARIKSDVVSRDEREGGLRRILNFGHTLGHGLEAASGFRMTHGQAVALGMVLEARLGESLGVTAPGVAEALSELAGALGMPVGVPEGVDTERVLGYVGRDKKALAGVARYVLLERLGRVAPGQGWVHEVSAERAAGVLESAAARG